MAAEPNERVSGQLTEAQVLELLRALPSALAAVVGSENIEAMYGWDANLHIDLCWKPMEVGTAWLDQFIRESLDPAIIVPGQSDFIFTVRGGALQVRFCHESDIHVSGTHPELISRFLAQAAFSELGFKMHTTPGDKPSSPGEVPGADA